MEISPEKLEICRQSARAREAERRIQLAARREQAWQVAKKGAAVLKKEFGATRVMIFGSVLHPERFHEGSDIDLAVWDVEHYFKALACLLDLEPGFSFDLVPVEDARPVLVKLIESEGVEL